MLFLYRLALQLGIWDVRGLAEEMSWEQCQEWMAAFQLMPWGDEWLRDAVIMAQQFNAHRGKDSRVMGVEEFMPVPARGSSPVSLESKFLTGAMRVPNG